jgi:hypothetical protein
MLIFCDAIFSNNLFSFTTDNILDVANREFCLANISGMRKIASRAAYMELVDCLARAVVGRKVYMESRMTKPLSEWFTCTDEAFLLLCLESYVPKWNRAWAQQQQQPEGAPEQNVEYEDARYTGRTKGTKLGWTKEGLERMNALMIDVVRDRQANGTHFDNIFKEEMIRKYTKEDTRNPRGREHDEEIAQENRVVLVYNDFNIGQLLAHAAMDTIAGGGGGGVAAIGQQQGNGEDDAVVDTSTAAVQQV